jgi:hypothetical protein
MSKNVRTEPQIHKIWANLDFLVFGTKKSKRQKSTQIQKIKNPTTIFFDFFYKVI